MDSLYDGLLDRVIIPSGDWQMCIDSISTAFGEHEVVLQFGNWTKAIQGELIIRTKSRESASDLDEAVKEFILQWATTDE